MEVGIVQEARGLIKNDNNAIVSKQIPQGKGSSFESFITHSFKADAPTNRVNVSLNDTLNKVEKFFYGEMVLLMLDAAHFGGENYDGVNPVKSLLPEIVPKIVDEMTDTGSISKDTGLKNAILRDLEKYSK